MSVHMLRLTQQKAPSIPLGEFLVLVLPGELAHISNSPEISKSKIRRLIIAGCVTVNGKQVRHPAFSIPKGSAIAVRFDAERFSFEKTPEDAAFEMTAGRILYEDEAVIVVDKPAGIPTEATIVASRDHLHAAVKRFLQTRDGTRNEPYVGLHHRLDRETSGVILFSKSRAVNAACHAMFETHAARKEYEALTAVRGLLPNEVFSVDNSLGRISAKSARAKWGAVLSGGAQAHTDFRVLERFDRGLRVLALPLTGRTHQIRVHLAGLGLPLLGDDLYGGPNTLDGYCVPRVMLHARSLSFPHPVTGALVTVNAPLPTDYLECLEFLGSEEERSAAEIRPR